MTSEPSLTVRKRRSHAVIACCVMLLAAQLSDSSTVHASCAAQAVQLLWSYPETGARDVPTNALLWASTSAWGSMPMATLNGDALEPQSTGTFSTFRMQPERLKPNSDYMLVLEYARNTGNGVEPARFEIKFTTGAGDAPDKAVAPEVLGSEGAEQPYTEHECAEVIAAQDCFDTGQSVLLRYDIAEAQPDETVAWLLTTQYQGSSVVWPARCGAPSVYVHKNEQLCHDVQRIGPGGRLSEAVEHCTDLTAPKDGAAGAENAAGQRGQPGQAKAGTGGVPAASEADAGRPLMNGTDAGTTKTIDEGTGVELTDMRDASSSCSATGGARTAARAFWAVVLISLLLAHHQRSQRRRPRAVTPSRRFRV